MAVTSVDGMYSICYGFVPRKEELLFFTIETVCIVQAIRKFNIITLGQECPDPIPGQSTLGFDNFRFISFEGW